MLIICTSFPVWKETVFMRTLKVESGGMNGEKGRIKRTISSAMHDNMEAEKREGSERVESPMRCEKGIVYN